MPSRSVRAVVVLAAIVLGARIEAAWAQGELFVTNQNANSVTVYARTANGDVAPLRTISGAATGLNLPQGLAVDSVNNELLVANVGGNSITVYALGANGNVAPLRTIAGAATGLNNPFGVAVDTVNNELAVANQIGNSITVYARTANGNVAPLRTISGAATGLNLPIGAAIDVINNEIVATSFQPGFDSVRVYGRTANGNVAPLRTISGAATGLTSPAGVAVDTVDNEVAVANFNGNSVTVYARSANGNVAPLRTISGIATGLSLPQGLATDPVNNELAVANVTGNSVTVYARTASGNVAPLRTLSGPSTGLNTPVFVAITTAGALAPPTIAKAFGAASIAPGGSTDLSFTIANPNGSTLTGVGFTDLLPAGLVVSTPNGLAGSCGGGAITAVAGSGSVSLADATLGAGASCSFSVSVTGATAGTKNNTTGAVTSIEGGTGGTATASLVVGTITITPSDIPTLQQWALALLALILVGAAALRWRRA